MSSNFPLNYNNNEICIYTVIAPEGKQLLLTLDSFNLAYGDVLHVYDDYLAIGYSQLLEFSGRASSSSSYSIYSPTVFETYRSTGQSFVILFLSDESETDEGFHGILSVIEGMYLEKHLVGVRASLNQKTTGSIPAKVN